MSEKDTLYALLEEKQERKDYADKIVSIVATKFRFVNIQEAKCRTSVMMNDVFQFLADQLNENNSPVFRRKIRNILIGRGLVRASNNGKAQWFKGLAYAEVGYRPTHRKRTDLSNTVRRESLSV